LNSVTLKTKGRQLLKLQVCCGENPKGLGGGVDQHAEAVSVYQLSFSSEAPTCHRDYEARALFIYLFIYFGILEFELRASHLLSRHSIA
jgi:hypothetical protein